MTQTFTIPVRLTIRCYEPNARRDPDNVVSGACKVVLDALQQIGVLQNDNRKHVVPILPPPEVGKVARVIVEIEEYED